jgi:hypothetical protein
MGDDSSTIGGDDDDDVVDWASFALVSVEEVDDK